MQLRRNPHNIFPKQHSNNSGNVISAEVLRLVLNAIYWQDCYTSLINEPMSSAEAVSTQVCWANLIVTWRARC
jgi:hypothetical protein